MKIFITLLSILISVSALKAGTFESKVTTGNWSVATTWTLTSGTDADGIPDADDDVTILAGHVITLNAGISYSRALTIDATGRLNTGGKKMYVQGNYTNNGTVSGGLNLVLNAANLVFSSASVFNNSGTIWINKTCTIAAGTIINKSGAILVQYGSTIVHNMGSVTLTGSVGQIKFTNTNNRWINYSGSSVLVNAGVIGNATSVFSCTAISNTVTYAGSSTSIISTNYNNLNMSSLTSKSFTTNVTISGNLSLTGTSANVLNIGANTLTLNGNLTTTGRLAFTTGKVIFNGTGTQTVDGTHNTQFYNMEINKTPASASVVFNAPKSVTHDLMMVSGNCNANNSLILASNSSTTARLAAITNTANVSFTGNLVIQKYYPAFSDQGDGSDALVSYRKFYHDLSSPVQTTTINDWDNELYLSGIGDYDGMPGAAGVDGWDYNNTPSVHTYASSTNTFVPVSGSTTTLTPAKGYDILMMDYRNTPKDSSEWYAKIIDTRGVPNYGDVSIPVIRNGLGGGWNLVGNPYASPITFSTSTLLSGGAVHGDNFIYIYENSDYQPYDRATTVIPPHQGFYIFRKTSGTGSGATSVNLVFTEATKVVDYTTNYHRQAPNFDIKLLLSSNSNKFYHENKILFNADATVDFDENFDAHYKQSPARISPNIFMFDKDGTELTINAINDIEDEVTIPLGIFTPKAGSYFINVSVLNTGSYNFAWIENIKTGAKYDINKAVVVEGEELGTNKDFVLRLSKKKQGSDVQTIVETNLIIFSTENTINLKSTIDNKITELMIYDMSGKIMLSQHNVTVLSGEITKIDVTNFASGIYIVQTIDEKGKVLSRKLIK